MKKNLMIVFVALLMMAALFAASANGETEPANASQICTMWDDYGFLGFESHGECVSNFNTSFCKYEMPDGTELWELWNFKNRGQCISFYAHF